MFGAGQGRSTRGGEWMTPWDRSITGLEQLQEHTTALVSANNCLCLLDRGAKGDIKWLVTVWEDTCGHTTSSLFQQQ